MNTIKAFFSKSGHFFQFSKVTFMSLLRTAITKTQGTNILNTEISMPCLKNKKRCIYT